ncbi:PilW family protein [Geopsychrobacter electrodiphilus]|uniref:PilW family protein n=1 Tax=Geopsychrobacter electrodiphilus TaxID=225196 RepID=UPI00036F5500|nr:PilW family protein [Geopsychrobacter electrodiphilus]
MTGSRGFNLVELLVVMALMSIISLITYPFFINFQFQSLSQINKSDLNDRANRLLNYLAEEVQETGFMVTSVPHNGDGTTFQIKHGASLETFSQSIRVEDVAGGNDRLDILKAVSFFPPLVVTEVDAGPPHKVKINRPPDYNVEINDAAGVNAILTRNQVIFENHKKIYRVIDIASDSPDLDLDGDGHKDRFLTLVQALAEPVPLGSEVLGVRVLGFFVDAGGLRADNYVTSQVLDKDIDGLQFEYFMKDGSTSAAPIGAAIENIRGIRIALLVRATRTDKNYVNTTIYTLGNRSYGPYGDGFRRVAVERLVEVKNYALE